MPLPHGTKFGGNNEPKPVLPEDVYQAEILDIVLQEKPKYNKPDEKEEVLTFKFGILDQSEYYGRWLFKDMRPILTGASQGKSASSLYEFLSAIAGRPLTTEECAAIDAERINKLIGKQVRLTVKVTEKGKNKVAGALKPKTVMPALKHEEEVAPPPDEEAPF